MWVVRSICCKGCCYDKNDYFVVRMVNNFFLFFNLLNLYFKKIIVKN